MAAMDQDIIDDINLEDDMLDDSIEDDAAVIEEKVEEKNGNNEAAVDAILAEPENAEEQPNELQKRLRQIEEEARKLREMQSEFHGANHSVSSGGSQQPPLHLTVEEKAELDSRSVYVGNVEYAATPEQLEEHFRGCGPIERVTIMSDKFSGHPKGFAYIQFTEIDGMQNAIALDESLFLGRQIKVSMKRTNKPGLSSTNRPPRGRGIRGRGFGRGFGGFRGVRGRPSRRRGFAPY